MKEEFIPDINLLLESGSVFFLKLQFFTTIYTPNAKAIKKGIKEK